MTQLLQALEGRLQELGFNPNQARDKDGKWTRVGGGDASPKALIDQIDQYKFNPLGGKRYNNHSPEVDADYDAAAAQLTDGFKDGTYSVRIRIPESVAHDLLLRDNGQFKTQHETGHSQGSFDPEFRDEQEEMMFGIPGVRPVYGYVAGFKKSDEDPAWPSEINNGSLFYGEISIVLKPEVAMRSTITLGDSLFAGLPPAKISDLTGEKLRMTSEFYNTGAKSILNGEIDNIGYVEAQIIGGVTKGDIQKIVVQEGKFGGTRIDMQQFRDAGYEVEIVSNNRHNYSFALGEVYDRRVEELACHDASCAPPPVGTGGSSKGGPSRGHLSPTEGGRVRPDPAYTSVKHMVRIVGGGTESGLKAALVKEFTMDLGDGYATGDISISVMSTWVEIKGAFTHPDSEERVGSFIRTIEFADGDTVIHNAVLNIRKDHQDKGIAQNFNDQALKYYNEIGADRIELETALEFGPYAWARQGYRFDGNSHFNGDVESQRKQWVDDRLDHIKAHTYKLTTKGDDGPTEAYLKFEQELIQIGNASRRGADVQPIHIASLGLDNPDFIGNNGMWPGKAALVLSPDNYSDFRTWHGVYYLGRESQLASAFERRIGQLVS